MDNTAKPAAAVAKRIPGADFEPGPSSPLNADGSPRWTVAQARRGFAAVRDATIRKEDASREAEAERRENVTSARMDDLRATILQRPGWKDS